MHRQGGVDSRFFQDPIIRKWDENTQRLALYFMITRKPRVRYRISLEDAQVDLKISMAKIEKALARIEADGFVSYDRKTRMLNIAGIVEWEGR